MLVPLTRQKFEELVPKVATSDQYRYCWGKPADFLRRLLISLVGTLITGLGWFLFSANWAGQVFIVAGIVMGLYWCWAPVYWASQRNRDCRRYQYSGFWQGEILDLFLTEELIGKEETVNDQGELVIVENRERRLNLEVGDETGFTSMVQVILKRAYRPIRPGDIAEMLVMSNRPDLSRINKISDIYLPDYDLWVSDYPILRRDAFVDVSRELRRRQHRSSSWE